MDWNDIWKIVLGVIGSVGGIGIVILAIVKFASGIIANRLEEKYSLKLNKELEKYKTNLDNKTYISRTKFDAEFNIYRELSKAFFEMVKAITIMIPSGLANYPADEEAKKEYENNLYDKASKYAVIAQDVLNSNAPFIPSNLFKNYDDILKLCKVQLGVFELRWDVNYRARQEEKECFSLEDYKRSREINEKFEELNENIRNYLAKLDVID